MQTSWRWDQGHSEYFKYNNLQASARGLTTLNSVDLSATGPDPLRTVLESETGLGFPSPSDHSLWRQYGRVFRATLLASRIGNNLEVSNLCRMIAGLSGPQLDADEYLTVLIPRFYYPSPVFEGYQPSGTQIFPFCALIRYLLALYKNGQSAQIPLNDVYSMIVGNDCVGNEDLSFYSGLMSTGTNATPTELRQLREMLTFLGQARYLKFTRGPDTLHLDLPPGDDSSLEAILAVATPKVYQRNHDTDQEILDLGNSVSAGDPELDLTLQSSPPDLSFAEGNRRMAAHLRIERSPMLRRFFLQNSPNPTLCDMCGDDTSVTYPWTDNLIDVHHVLPLSSAVTLEGSGTTLQDVIGLCPTCHRGTHRFYSQWLTSRNQTDFNSREEAADAYNQAKHEVNP